MCCYNNPFKVKKLLKSGKKQIRGYKIYKLYSKPEYDKKFLESEYRYFRIHKPGIVLSNSGRQKPSMKYEEINKGIHVFLEKPVFNGGYYSNYSNYSNYIVIPVICKIKDLIAANDKTAVFKKVILSKNAWKNATPKNIIK